MNSSELTFSVIVNTTDRAHTLRTLLRSLEHQSYPHFEVIVVVGPTHDNTFDMLDAYGARVRVLRCAQANLSKSRNIGLAAARGDIVAYIDDDAVPARNWLLQLNRIFANPSIDMSGGVVYLVHPNRPVFQHRIGFISAMAEQKDVRDSLLDGMPLTGAGRLWTQRQMGTNMAMRRTTLLEIGGFDEFYEWVYDETDLAMRMAAAGKVIQPVMEAPVYHVPASSRNRVAFTNSGRWWIQTKAAVYFCFRNGSTAGVPARLITRKALEQAHGHWLWLGDVHRNGEITLGELTNYRWQEVKALMQGFRAAKIGARHLLAHSQQAPDDSQPAAFQPYLTPDSARQPAVDPVSGRQAQLALGEPPLRIALLSFNYPPDPAEGISRYTSMLAKGLFELGQTVHVIAHGRQPGVSFDGSAYVHRIDYKLERYANLRHLPRLHHLLNYSHAVHDAVTRLVLNDDVQLVDSPLWKADGLVTAISGTLPVIVRPQTALRQVAAINAERDLDAKLIGEVEEQLLRRASYVVANSQATNGALRKVYGLDLESIPTSVIPHGIEPAPDADIRPYPVETPPVEQTVLYVGRLEKRKGTQELFAAIPTILTERPNTRFILAGSDNSGTDGFRSQTGLDYPSYFRRKYPQYAESVTFLGHVEEDELQQLYQSCDLFVAPSLYESFGLIYLEAMNYAKPVVGCKAGGIPEIVDDGVTGALVEPGSPIELAQAMLDLLRSPQKLREFGLAGRQRFLDRFTHLHMARAFLEVYRATLQSWRAPASSEQVMNIEL